MKIITKDTYEASWYLMMGGVLSEIAFGKVSENKRIKKGFTQQYKFTIDNVEVRFVNYWKDHNAIGNIRKVADTRKKLKKRIHRKKMEKKWEGYIRPKK